MSAENVLSSSSDGIATVTVNRPDKMNALNAETIRELTAAFASFRDDPSIRVVILTGSGEKAFVAGADIGELARHNAEEARENSRKGQALLDLIENLGKPVIAAINGFALGGGCELAMAATFRIASENAKLGQPEVNLGIMPGYAGTLRLPRLVGKGRAAELILTGDLIDAAEAYRIGLVNKVVPSGALMESAMGIARKIAAKAPLAVKYALEAVNRGADVPMREGETIESALFGVCFATEDKAEGTKAFLEKRKPQFKGK
ncbi:MAG: hypothetical protein A2Z34_05950 [Planctomycetes bacterium RBG_16_59_8]|nr:MAG: hypothetical protein A2Z34_05950 [Planctomycetes bacterium RBG_16_59_8]